MVGDARSLYVLIPGFLCRGGGTRHLGDRVVWLTGIDGEISRVDWNRGRDLTS